LLPSGATTALDKSNTDLAQISSLDVNSGTPYWNYQVPGPNRLPSSLQLSAMTS